MVAPLVAAVGGDARVLVGPETGDDAGVYLQDGVALVATVDFITPVCDEPRRFGRIAAANSVSDVYAMGGRPLFALNLCCFPEDVPREVLCEILAGGVDVLREAGAVLLGGHTVRDAELKFGMAVIGRADPQHLLTNAGACVGDRLILTKPLGTGVMINAYRTGKLDAEGLEPALGEMERLNERASELALAHHASGGTDITGFGLAGHLASMARASNVAVRIRYSSLPFHAAFPGLVEAGVTTGSTEPNEISVASVLEDRAGLTSTQRELLFDPQTSGGMLVSVPAANAPDLLRDLLATGHRAAEIGEVLPGPTRLVVI